MEKKLVCILFGGKSGEYFVSLKSVSSILSNIDKERYDIIKIGITKEGKWLAFTGDDKDIINDRWQKSGCTLPVLVDFTTGEIILGDKRLRVDLFFPVMHGEMVEDGRLQGLFDIIGAKYIGCGAFSSFVCMDKHLTKNVARSLFIPVARDILVDKSHKPFEEISYPVFVKPTMGGSSLGVSYVTNKEELRVGIEKALSVSNKALIEEAIKGREVEVAILEDKGKVIVSSVGMIKYNAEFYDYEEKYNSQEIEYIIPAPISEKTEKYIQECAKKLFLHLGCRGLSRFDFFVTEKGGVVFNEVNTMPGFTEISMFPKLFIHYGFSFSQIIDILLSQ